nr:prepilin-type N-terminal cleavage/methylation domain-containing protein [Kineosporia rhizophila]
MRSSRRRRSDDDGLTLVELMVTMGVASVLMVAIGVVFLGTIRGVTTINVKTAATADARITMEAMTRSLRVAVRPVGVDAAIVSATMNQVSFYSLLNRTGTPAATAPNPTLVRYWHDGSCVNQSSTPATTGADGSLTWNPAGTRTICLARTVTAPVFTYYLTSATTTEMTIGSGLSLNDRNLVRSVGISLSMKSAASPTVSPVPLVDRVTLTNLIADDSNSAESG